MLTYLNLLAGSTMAHAIYSQDVEEFQNQLELINLFGELKLANSIQMSHPLYDKHALSQQQLAMTRREAAHESINLN
jgi:hypothetical protein